MASFFDSSLPPWLIPPDYAKTFNDAFAQSAAVAQRNREGNLREKMFKAEQAKVTQMRDEEQRYQSQFGTFAKAFSSTDDPVIQQRLLADNINLANHPRTAQGYKAYGDAVDRNIKIKDDRDLQFVTGQIQAESAAIPDDYIGQLEIVRKFRPTLIRTPQGTTYLKEFEDGVMAKIKTKEESEKRIKEAAEKEAGQKKVDEDIENAKKEGNPFSTSANTTGGRSVQVFPNNSGKRVDPVAMAEYEDLLRRRAAVEKEGSNPELLKALNTQIKEAKAGMGKPSSASGDVVMDYDPKTKVLKEVK
jgi:hypothetical protein